MHAHYEFNGGIFKDSQGQPLMNEPIAKQSGSEELVSYKTWLALLTEQITGSLSPNAKGKNTGCLWSKTNNNLSKNSFA